MNLKPRILTRRGKPIKALVNKSVLSRTSIADCLGVEIEEVTPEARFFEDLGGESIDLLSLSFQFEKAFNIRTP